MRKKTITDWQNEVDDLLLDIRRQFLRVGEVLFRAKPELSATEFEQLQDHIRRWGLRASDMRACRAAFLFKHPELGTGSDQRLPPELFFSGCSNSKILFMASDQQQRLLSGEKFATVLANGKVDKPKSWAELSDAQRNILIDKGGRILTVEEQTATLRGKKIGEILVHGSLQLRDGQIMSSSSNGALNMRTSLDNYAQMILKEEGLWNALLEAVEEARCQPKRRKVR